MNVMKTLLQLSAYSSIMIVSILALKAIFKEKINLKIIMFVWALILIRLLIPFTFDSPLHFDNIMPEVPKEDVTIEYQEEITETADAEPNIIYPAVMNETEYNTYAEPQISTHIEPEVPTLFEKVISFIKSISVWSYTLIIWITGVLIFMLNGFVSYYKFNKATVQCITVKDTDINNMISELKSMLNITQNVNVIISRNVNSPMTFKLIRPIIIIPVSLTTRISKEKLRMVLLHEFCHIKRKDIFYNMLWMAAKTIHWFNPFVWIAYNNYIEDIELSCDEMVNSYLSEEQSFVYSQSLIDVIRFSKNIVKLPVAMSFCEDKSKLRKRVENMLKPQKKLKSAGGISLFLAVIMIVTCFTTACQPTPENLVVQNKNDGELEAAIEQTAAPTESAQPAATEKPKIIVQDVSSNASNTVSVDINAEVINNQPENIPVAMIQSSPYTQDELLHMINVFFGNTQLYTKDWVKEDFENYILNKQYEMNDPEQLQAYADIRDITDLAYAKELIQDTIDRAKNNMADASADRVLIDLDDALNSDRGLDCIVQTRDGFLGDVHGTVFTAFNDDDIYYRAREMAFYEYIEETSTDPEFLNAKQLAIQLVEDMNIDNVTFGDAYTSKDARHTDNGVQLTGREFYVFCFDAIIGNSVMDGTKNWYTPPSLIDLSGKDGYEDLPEIHYDEMIPYDRLEVWVEGDRIVQFKHRYPVEVTEIMNDNVAIAVDYPEATEIAKQFAYTAFINPFDWANEVNLDIYRIELVLVRIKEKDTGNDIVVPAWNFCGVYSYKDNPDDDYEDPDIDENGWVTMYAVENTGDVLITVNALDGSIIDMSRGY